MEQGAFMSNAGPWNIFPTQVNGPAPFQAGVDPALFRHEQLKGGPWSEDFYHHLQFPDGTVMSALVGFNGGEASVLLVLAKPGMKMIREHETYKNKKVTWQEQGFGVTIGPNRMGLEGDKHQLELELGKVKARITYEPLARGFTYGDGMVRYPDGKSFACYRLPIPWAKVHVEAMVNGVEYRLDGLGNMNHDHQVLSIMDTPPRWRCWWLLGEDHALALTEFNPQPKFGETLVQRLVFMDRAGAFTSTAYDLKWDDWVEEDKVAFRYPRRYTLAAEAGGVGLTAEMTARDLLVKEDLFSNLPAVVRTIAKTMTKNGWIYDWRGDYAIVVTREGRRETYCGRGVARWMALEEK
jgi:hypothetical protein